MILLFLSIILQCFCGDVFIVAYDGGKGCAAADYVFGAFQSRTHVCSENPIFPGQHQVSTCDPNTGIVHYEVYNTPDCTGDILNEYDLNIPPKCVEIEGSDKRFDEMGRCSYSVRTRQVMFDMFLDPECQKFNISTVMFHPNKCMGIPSESSMIAQCLDGGVATLTNYTKLGSMCSGDHKTFKFVKNDCVELTSEFLDPMTRRVVEDAKRKYGRRQDPGLYMKLNRPCHA